VAVLAGGRSSEHEISLASARSVVAALDPERYDTVVVEIDKGGRWELASGRDELPATSIETLPVVAHSAPARCGRTPATAGKRIWTAASRSSNSRIARSSGTLIQLGHIPAPSGKR